MKPASRGKTIAVYSVRKGTGKSTVARELAGFCQIDGKKTLLVDLTLGRSRFLEGALALAGPDLSDWLDDIENRLRNTPWHAIEYTPEEIQKHIRVNSTGLGILSCAQRKTPGGMPEAVGVILNSLARLDYGVMVFDLNSEVRDYVIRVLSAVDEVLLVTDTYRYDVGEVKMTMERLKDAGCRMDHFRVVFNRKPSFFDDDPLQVAEEFNLPMAGSLPDYPRLSRDFLTVADEISEYTQAMKKLIASL